MKPPSAAQLKVLIGVQSGGVLSRDDTTIPAVYRLDDERLNSETFKVLYCRRWISAKSRHGYYTVYELSESGPAAIGSAFAINTVNFKGQHNDGSVSVRDLRCRRAFCARFE